MRFWRFFIPFSGTEEEAQALFDKIIELLEQSPGYSGDALLMPTLGEEEWDALARNPES